MPGAVLTPGTPGALNLLGYSRTITAAVDPTVNSDSTLQIKIGDWWLNTVTGNLFQAQAVAPGAAIWRFYPRTWSSVGPSTTLTGSVAETVMNTLSLPGGIAGANGIFDIENDWGMNNNANGKTGRTKIGAAGSGTGATEMRSTVLASLVNMYERVKFKNQNAANAQNAFHAQSGGNAAAWGGAAGAPLTAAINTAAAFELVWTGTLTNAGDSVTLLNWHVTLSRPDIAPP